MTRTIAGIISAIGKSSSFTIRKPVANMMNPPQALKSLIMDGLVSGTMMPASRYRANRITNCGTAIRETLFSSVQAKIIAAAQKELDTRDSEKNRSFVMTKGSEIDAQDYLVKENGIVTDLDWDGYVHKITRMKAAPAFDGLYMNTPENEEFGDEHTDARHFTQFSMDHSLAKEPKLADSKMVTLLNPTCYIGRADNAQHWRIRHGAFDRDTSIAIPVILSLLLKNSGIDTDFALPWGLPHSGDYDLEELFAWIDSLCK